MPLQTEAQADRFGSVFQKKGALAMDRWFRCLIVTIAVGSAVLLSAPPSFSEELVVKSCQDLIGMAENCRQDLRTVGAMLGSAVDVGDIQRIRNYKLKRSALQKQLQSVLKALEIKECVMPTR